MARRTRGRQVVYVERGGDSSVKWLLYGAVLGAGLALMYAPKAGEETRRGLQRRMWKLRAVTEEKLDELSQKFTGGRDTVADELDDDDEFETEAPTLRARATVSPREELERRLADARARRRSADELEEPPA